MLTSVSLDAAQPAKVFFRPVVFVTNVRAELKNQPFAQTLAHKLGDVPHVSGLLRRIAHLSGAGERVAERLLKVAVERGAKKTGSSSQGMAERPGEFRLVR